MMNGLRIAVVADNYKEGRSFIEHKFKNKIVSVNMQKQLYILENGDEIYLLYRNADMAKSCEFDAYCISSCYETLENVVRYRCSR